MSNLLGQPTGALVFVMKPCRGHECIVSASRVQTMLMCAEAQESRAMLPDEFSLFNWVETVTLNDPG